MRGRGGDPIGSPSLPLTHSPPLSQPLPGYPSRVPRILAIDFGEKRIGLATCDATGQVVAARRTLSRKSDAAAVSEIARFCLAEEVEAIVLGIPRSPEGVESPFASRVRSFGDKLSGEIGIPIDYHEETLTSWAAQREAAFQTKEEVDRGAAAILLSDYLAMRAARAEGSRT